MHERRWHKSGSLYCCYYFYYEHVQNKHTTGGKYIHSFKKVGRPRTIHTRFYILLNHSHIFQIYTPIGCQSACVESKSTQKQTDTHTHKIWTAFSSSLYLFFFAYTTPVYDKIQYLSGSWYRQIAARRHRV